jgi:hypothetical protein
MKLEEIYTNILNEEEKPIQILPRGKQIILQAEEDNYTRGLLVELLDDGGYEIQYWIDDPTNVMPIEVFIDGESYKEDGKVIKLGFHPELKNTDDEM